MSFIKKIEDFICEHCGMIVQGDGYTNHCPECLWSKHVDVDPGDRSALCGGLMAPTGFENKCGEERLIHECVKCGKRIPNRLAKGDNRGNILRIFG